MFSFVVQTMEHFLCCLYTYYMVCVAQVWVNGWMNQIMDKACGHIHRLCFCVEVDDVFMHFLSACARHKYSLPDNNFMQAFYAGLC